MRRIRQLLVMIGYMLLFIVLVGCSGKSADKEFKEEVIAFRLAEVHPPDFPTTLADREFARLVEEKTGGRIIIKVNDSESLGTELEVLEQVQFGAIDFARTSINPVSEFAPLMNVLQLPYIYKSSEHMWRVLNSDIGDYFLEGVGEAGFIGLTYYDAGARNFYNSKREITQLSDLEGLKFRVMQSQLMIDMAEALGATVVPMTYSDVYQNIQTGEIDGAENNYPSYASSLHYEVAKFYTIDEHVRVPEILLASKKILDRISEEDLALIKACALESQIYQREKWSQMEKEYEQLVIESGCQITVIEDRTEFIQAVQSLYEKYAAGYADIIDRIKNME